jgi:DNA-binding CsgD family transcriptional regulator
MIILSRVRAWLEDQRGGRFPFTESCVIGRLPVSTVRLDDRQVSRRHALIIAHGLDDHWLVDFGSSNGTRLNGLAITEPRRLKDGDTIEISAHKFLFREKRDGRHTAGGGRSPVNWEETEKKFMAYQPTGQGIAVLKPDGTVQIISPRAQTWLVRYFEEAGLELQTLPRELNDWVKKRQHQGATDRTTSPFGMPLLLIRDDKRLRIQMVDSGDGQFVLLFSEEELLVTQSSLQRLGLTARESEVMFWLAEGKANAEIGAILESSPRTIERHVANILKKFQVENRVAAVRHVAERLQPRGISN